MNPLRILGLVLIAAGLLALAIGHVSVTRSTHQINVPAASRTPAAGHVFGSAVPARMA